MDCQAYCSGDGIIHEWPRIQFTYALQQLLPRRVSVEAVGIAQPQFGHRSLDRDMAVNKINTVYWDLVTSMLALRSG